MGLEATAIWSACEQGRLSGHLVASTLTDIFYIAHRITDLQHAHAAVRVCLDTFAICPVDRAALEVARNLPGNDFEDNLLIACAMLAGLDSIVTRNQRDFQAASLTILSPTDLLAQLTHS